MADSTNWVEDANREVVELQAAAKDSPKDFFGNRQRGMGAGLARVKALRTTANNIKQALDALDRVL